MTPDSRTGSRFNRRRLFGLVALVSMLLAFGASGALDFGGGRDEPRPLSGGPPGSLDEGSLSFSGDPPEQAASRSVGAHLPFEEEWLETEGPYAAPSGAAEGASEADASAAPVRAAVVLEPPPEIDAPAFAVMERGCGALVWGKNETERLPPASLTKVITALVVMDTVSLDEVVESHVSGQKMQDRGSSVMGVEPGMRLKVLDLLNGLLLESGNDAALVLAEHAGGGDVEAFLEAMNAKARALGMTDTHFVNPHGLDKQDHYSSALDMAKAGLVFLEDPVLAEISTTDEYWPAWSGESLRNGNKLLTRYPGAYGVKIGYTRRASQTMIAAAQRDGRHLVVSLFGSEDRYGDTMLLLDWAFAKTSPACEPALP